MIMKELYLKTSKDFVKECWEILRDKIYEEIDEIPRGSSIVGFGEESFECVCDGKKYKVEAQGVYFSSSNFVDLFQIIDVESGQIIHQETLKDF